jgi:hypothetical protein
MPLYPGGSTKSPEWVAIVEAIGARSGYRCEGSRAYPECRAGNGEVHPITRAIVVLQVCHVDQDPRHSDPENLRHWCQLCHNTHDALFRAKNAQRTKADNARCPHTLDLFGEAACPAR